MNPWIAVLRALPLTFIVYVGTTLLGIIQALPVSSELGRAFSLPFSRGSAGIASLERLLSLAAIGRAQGLSLLLSLAAYALLTPWLQMAWFSALSEPRSPGSALGHGARLYTRAWLASLWIALFSLLALAPFPLLAWLARMWLETHGSERTQDLTTLLLLAPLPFALALVLAWQDLARARCLSRRALMAVRLGLRDALKPRYIGSYLGWTSASWGLLFAARWLELRTLHASSAVALFSVMLVQIFSLARSVLRSRWLTQTLIAADDMPPTQSKDSP